MSGRGKPAPIDWRDTAQGREAYREAKERAQYLANQDGFDRGLEWNELLRHVSIVFLPRKENRYGFELRCEVVSCSDLSKCQPGHGP